ncbi:MAG: hypothetical protein KGJ57_18255 [Sphingomonadales bacterium]|nr:hypothetical protein [Sphingomonadales bacterium]MDE2171342.1 hypothetical protein [Sphingomonadales bacterium]
MSNYDQRCAEDARLAILAELAQQDDATLNSRSLARIVEAVVPRRPREWIETQLDWLKSMGAIRLTKSDLPGLGPVSIAVLTRTGRDHVEQRTRLSGITAPADVE